MSLLFPLGLLALLSALLPLLIHLARRHPYTPLDFAALRWLRARVRPRQRIRFDDWPLLLVRLLLLAALAVLLARPALTGPAPAAPAWTVVAPGLDAQALRGKEGTAPWHWLAPAFPEIDQPVPVQTATLPSLLRELDARLPAGTALVVHVPDPLSDLDGQRLQLSRTVRWVPHAVPLRAATPAATAAPVLRLHSGATAPVQRWAAAVQRAWHGQVMPPALAGGALPGAGEIGVWSGGKPLPGNWQRWLQQGGQVLVETPAPATAPVLLRAEGGEPLLLQQRVGRGRLLHLVGGLDVAVNPALQRADLPRQLRIALQGEPRARVGDARDHAPTKASRPAARAEPRDIGVWLAVLLLLLFGVERWLASAPQRRRRA